MLIKVKKVSESVVVIDNEIAENTEKDCNELKYVVYISYMLTRTIDIYQLSH